MLSDLRLLAWLEARHARTAVARAFYLVGTDPVTDRSAASRAYQAYAAAVVLAALALLWLALLNGVETAFAALPPHAGEALLRVVFLAASLALGLKGAASATRGPASFSEPDVRILLAGPMRAQLAMAARCALSCLRSAAAGALAGFACGAACASAGLPLDPTAAALDIALVFAGVTGFSWVAGTLRLCRGKAPGHKGASEVAPPFVFGGARGRAALVAGAVLVAAAGTACACAAPFEALLRAVSWQVAPLMADVVVSELALVFAFGPRVDVAVLSQLNARFAGVPRAGGAGVFGAEPLGASAAGDALRRRRLALRPPRGSLPRFQGAGAIVSKAAVSLLRQREGWLSLALVGAAVVPLGTLCLVAGENPALLLAWCALPQYAARHIRELARPYRDDRRIVLVRDRLPFPSIALFALGVAPAAAVALALQAAVLALAACAGTLSGAGPVLVGVGAGLAAAPAEVALVSVLVLAGLVACCAFDGAALPWGCRAEIGYEWAAFAFSVACALAAAFAPGMPALAGCLAAIDAALACIALRCVV